MSPAKAYILDQSAGKLRWKGTADVDYVAQGGGSTLVPITTTEAPTVTAQNTGLMGASLTPANWNSYQNATGQVIEYMDFTYGSTWAQLFGSNNIFRYCRWANLDFAVKAPGNRFEHCEAGKITASDNSDGFRLYDYKSIDTFGMDALGVSGDPLDILMERIYAVTTRQVQEGEHFDSLQIRGVDGFVLRNFIFDHGGDTPVGSPYNATLFFENAGNGNHNALVEQGYLRSLGLNNMYLFATGLRLHNLVLAGGATDVYEPSWDNYQYTNIRRPNGTPVTLY